MVAQFLFAQFTEQHMISALRLIVLQFLKSNVLHMYSTIVIINIVDVLKQNRNGHNHLQISVTTSKCVS